MAPIRLPYLAAARDQENPEAYFRLHGWGHDFDGAINEITQQVDAQLTPGTHLIARADGFTGDGNQGVTLKGAAGDGIRIGYPVNGYYRPGSDAPFSVAIWFKSSSATRQIIYGRSTEATGRGWSVFLRSDGKLEFKAVDIAGTTLWDLVSAATYADGAAHHLVVVGAIAASAASLYVDGVLIGQTSPYDAAVIADGATGYWKLNVDGTASVSANNGTVIAENALPTFAAAGPFMDATNAFYNPGAGPRYVDIGNVAAYGFTAAFSVEAWISFNTADSNLRVIAGKSTFAGNGSGWTFFSNSADVANNAKIALQLYTSGGSLLLDLKTPAGPYYNDGRWHHVVATWDGTTGANGAKLYVDGELIAQATKSAGTVGTPANSLTIGINSDASGASAYQWKGGLGKVAVYGAVTLTAAQVRAHYRAAVQAGTPEYTAGMQATIGGGYPAYDTFVLKANTMTVGTGGTTTTSGVDTTGANLILVSVTSVTPNVAPTDNKGNTYTQAAARVSSSSNTAELWYCVNPVVGTGHTFTIAANTSSIGMQAWSGASSVPFEQWNGVNTGASPGPVTPVTQNALVVSVESTGSGGDPSAATGLTVSNHVANSGSAFGLGMAYVIQTTPTLVNTTWTLGGGTGSGVVAVFQPAIGAPTSPLLGTVDDLGVYPYGLRSDQVVALYAGRLLTVGTPAPKQARAGIARAGAARSDGARQQAIVTIGGLQVLAKKGTVQISEIIDEPAEASFEVEYKGKAFSDRKLVAGQEVIICSGSISNRIFGGTVVRARSHSLADAATRVCYGVTTADWRYLFNKRLVTKVYPIGMSYSDVVVDIASTFTVEGFTTRHVKSGGPIIATAPQVFIGVRAWDALLQVKEICSAQGWGILRIDAYKDLHFADAEPSERFAPIVVGTVGYDLLEYEEDITQVRNLVTARGPGSTVTALTAIGATSIPVADTYPFWGGGLGIYQDGVGQAVLTPYGDVVNFTSISVLHGPGNLTGVPASGVGSIKTALQQNDTIAPLAGVPLVPSSAPTLFDVQMAAREGGYKQLITERFAPGWWRLAEPSGSVAVDAKLPVFVSAHNGTYSSGVTLGTPGPLADGTTGATFDGSAGNVNIGNVADFSFQNAFSVEAWVKATATPALAVIAGKLSQAIDRGWALFWFSGVGKIQFFAASTTGSEVFNFQTDLPYNDGAWHHIVATYDGTTSVDGAAIYVDGVLVKTATPASAQIGVTTDPARIASYGNGSGGFFNGAIKDVVFYDRWMRPDHVAEAYAARLKPASTADGKHQYLLDVPRTEDLQRAFITDSNANNHPAVSGSFWTMNPQARVGRLVTLNLPSRGVRTFPPGATIQRVTRKVEAPYRWSFTCEFANIWRDLNTLFRSFK